MRPRMLTILSLLVLCGWLLVVETTLADSATLKVAVFDVDATPPIGSPVAYAPAIKILDPLHARGIILLPGDQPPIVLCAVDWIGISNGGHDRWRADLAKAAGTTCQRVTVHCIHQHDGPRFDSDAIGLYPTPEQAAVHYDVVFVDRVLHDVADAIATSLLEARPVTHIGMGRAKVDKVASNRRILGPDGKVIGMRFSSCRTPELIAAPEGVIDPFLQMVSLWNGDEPLVSLTYYASHPQSYYGKGEVTAEFVGLARAKLEQATNVMDVHFTGAGGNIAAGKYNDGSPPVRPILTQRMTDAMNQAWNTTVKKPITAADVEWRIQPVRLPVAEHLAREPLLAILNSADSSDSDRSAAASNLAWLERCLAETPIELSCLRLGNAYLVHMPGELFVEYQLAAQKMCAGTVCMAAYGDYGPGYIGTEVAYGQGGYETSPGASRVAPQTEHVLMPLLKKLVQ